jgi:hypothetical protein
VQSTIEDKTKGAERDDEPVIDYWYGTVIFAVGDLLMIADEDRVGLCAIHVGSDAVAEVADFLSSRQERPRRGAVAS